MWNYVPKKSESKIVAILVADWQNVKYNLSKYLSTSNKNYRFQTKCIRICAMAHCEGIYSCKWKIQKIPNLSSDYISCEFPLQFKSPLYIHKERTIHFCKNWYDFFFSLLMSSKQEKVPGWTFTGRKTKVSREESYEKREGRNNRENV